MDLLKVLDAVVNVMADIPRTNWKAIRVVYPREKGQEKALIDLQYMYKFP